MKVYCFSFHLDKNSSADYFISLCNKLSNIGKVIIIASKIRETNVTLDPRITVFKWPSYRPTQWKDFIFLCNIVKKYKPHAIISNFSAVNLFLIVGILFRVKHRVAWIRTLSSQFPQKKLYILRRSLIYKLSTQIIVNSEATKDDASDFYSIKKDKIIVLPNSVKDYSGGLQDIPTDYKKIVYVGRLHPTKGVDILIKSLAVLVTKKYDIHLDIIGNGPQLKELEQLRNELNLSNHVFFLGTKTKEDVLIAYKSSYCTVIPSTSEAFGSTVIEAMSVGTCVIGANNTGIKEIIVGNKTGLLFETGNHYDLACNLEMVLDNQTLRDCLATRGFERFVEYYENNYAIQRDFEFFKRLT